jgi:hypothetical protein
MLRLETLPPSAAWQPDADTIASFDGAYRVCRLHGPARLMRLLTLGGVAAEGQGYDPNAPQGSFWFAEANFQRLKMMAEADLRSQSGPGILPEATMRSHLRMYLRLQLRDFLAVRRNWTPSFDRGARLSVPKGESLVALVGRVRWQPVYSPEFVGEPAARDLERMGLRLPGGLTQYVINFSFPTNHPARAWIQTGVMF